MKKVKKVNLRYFGADRCEVVLDERGDHDLCYEDRGDRLFLISIGDVSFRWEIKKGGDWRSLGNDDVRYFGGEFV